MDTSSVHAVLMRPPEDIIRTWYDFSESLGIGYIAAHARQAGYTVDIIDCVLEELSCESAVKQVMERPPSVVGISVLQVAFEEVRKIVDLLRQAGFKGHICLGGHFPTFRYSEILQVCEEISSVIRFEGERSFTELLEAYHNGWDWRHIPGIAFQTDTGVHCNTPRPLVQDLDNLSFPARDCLPHALRTNRTITISGSRGCWCDCVFCTVTSFYDEPTGPRWRGRSPISIVDEMEYLSDQYACSSFTFVDDNFMGAGRRGKVRASEIAGEIIRRRLKVEFSIECRTDDVERDLMMRLKEAGLRSVFIGVESGLDSRLKRLGKRNLAKNSFRALGVLSDLGLTTVVGFILFDPHVTLEEIRGELEFLRQFEAFDLPALIRCLEIRPGMQLYSELLAEDRLFGPRFKEYYEFEDRRVALLHTTIMDVLPWHVGSYMKCRELLRKQKLGKEIADDFLSEIRSSALSLVEMMTIYIGQKNAVLGKDYECQIDTWKVSAERQCRHINRVMELAHSILPNKDRERTIEHDGNS